MNIFLENLIRQAEGKSSLTAQETANRLNHRSAPGVRWTVKGSEESKKFEAEHQAERQRRISESEARRQAHEHLDPNWDQEAVNSVYRQLDYHWKTSIAVGGTSEQRELFSWMLKCASKKTNGAEWIRQWYNTDEAWKMYRQAKGFEYLDQMFDLDWGQSWE